ncbi:hypothetical protein GCM10020220_080550 [Nonomuraea rubra]|uniref:hypothetical protein n=1 Tax=Nonomuraea rubra TaxID=46180 RepID=UPI0031EBA176
MALLATLVAGALIGAWQGYWIAYFGIPAFIVTLAGMLLFRALTMTVLGNQGIGPFPDQVRTLANGFTDGYLGNIGLGPLGGADLFSLLIGVVAIAGMFTAQLRTRNARKGYGQSVEPMALFWLKMIAGAAIIMFLVIQLARFKKPPVGAGPAGDSRAGLLDDGQPHRLRAARSTRSAATSRRRSCPA